MVAHSHFRLVFRHDRCQSQRELQLVVVYPFPTRGQHLAERCVILTPDTASNTLSRRDLVTTFILGAGASHHVGYPLASKLGIALAEWIENSKPQEHLYRIRIQQLKQHCSLDNFESVISDLDDRKFEPMNIGVGWHPSNMIVDLKKAMREFFNCLSQNDACLYRLFALNHVQPGDLIITFNYDVSLERELKQANKWEIGDGYGFEIFPTQTPHSSVKVLKLHGSSNWQDLLSDKTGYGKAASSVLLHRPVIEESDLGFLGYEIKDPEFQLDLSYFAPTVLMPVLHKKFFTTTTWGHEREDFWNDLWNQAALALDASNEIVICGYSLPKADERARDLMFRHINRKAPLTICCRGASETIRNGFQHHGFQHLKNTGSSFREWLSRTEQ